MFSKLLISCEGRNLLTSSKLLLRWIVSSKCRSAAGFPPATTRNTFLEFAWGIGAIIRLVLQSTRKKVDRSACPEHNHNRCAAKSFVVTKNSGWLHDGIGFGSDSRSRRKS